MTAIVGQIGPLLTVILAGCFLGEKLECHQLIVLLIAFFGVVLMIVGGSPQDEEVVSSKSWYLYLLLMLNPVFIATGELAMRRMKKMPDTVVSLYMNLALFFVSYLVISFNGDDFTTWKKFDFWDWLLMFSLSCTTLISQSLKFLAL
jgi:drug/metabolite transporter (DMT)-like permease